MGVAYVAQDVTGKGPASVKRWFGRRKAALAQVLWRTLARMGYHRRLSVEIQGAVAMAGAGGLTGRLRGVRAPGRTIEQKVADLETDLAKIDDRVAEAEGAVKRLERELEAQGEGARKLAQETADERIDAWNRERFPIQMRSLAWLVAGIVLNVSGGVLSLGA